VGGKFHSIKADQRFRQLVKGIKKGKFSGNDLTLAKALAVDLAKALAGK